MLFIQYGVDFMLLLAQTNTSTSWFSSRAAVQSIKTEEKANVVHVPASPWRVKIINIGLSCKKNHKGRQTLEAAGDSVMPSREAGSHSGNSSHSRTGEGIPGLQLQSVNCPHRIKELHSPACAITDHRTEKASKAFCGITQATKQRGSNMLWEDLCPGVGQQNLFVYSLGFKKMKFSWTFHNHYSLRCFPNKCICIN